MKSVSYSYSQYVPNEAVSEQLSPELKAVKNALSKINKMASENKESPATLPTELGREIGKEVIAHYLDKLPPVPHHLKPSAAGEWAPLNSAAKETPASSRQYKQTSATWLGARRFKGSIGDTTICSVKTPELLFEVSSTLADGQLYLHEAIRKNRMDIFTQAVQQMDKEALNKVDKSGITVLGLAVLLGKHEAIRILLKKGASIDQKNGEGILEGTDAIDLAGCSGEVAVLRNFLLPALRNKSNEEKQQILKEAEKISKSAGGRWGHSYKNTQILGRSFSTEDIDTDFRKACRQVETTDNVLKSIGEMAMLMKRGAIIDKRFTRFIGRRNVLYEAIEESRLKSMQALILLGADVNGSIGIDKKIGRTGKEDTMLTVCYTWEKDEYQIPALKLLLKLGADIERGEHGRNALHNLFLCCTHDRNTEEQLSEVIDILIDAGVDINKRDHYGCTPLIYACYAKFFQAATKLINAGADVKTVSLRNPQDIHPDVDSSHLAYHHEKSALYWVASFYSTEKRRDMRYGGPDRSEEAFDLFKLIVEKNYASLFEPHIYGTTPYQLIKEVNEEGLNKFFVQRITEAKNDLKKDEDGTPLLLQHMLLHTLKKGPSEIVKLLLDNQANPQKLTKNGFNALHLLSKNRDSEKIAGMLFEILPEDVINEQDEDGNTPLHLSVIHGNNEFRDFLKMHHAEQSSRNNAGKNFGDLMCERADGLERILKEIESTHHRYQQSQQSYYQPDRLSREDYFKKMSAYEEERKRLLGQD